MCFDNFKVYPDCVEPWGKLAVRVGQQQTGFAHTTLTSQYELDDESSHLEKKQGQHEPPAILSCTPGLAGYPLPTPLSCGMAGY